MREGKAEWKKRMEETGIGSKGHGRKYTRRIGSDWWK